MNDQQKAVFLAMLYNNTKFIAPAALVFGTYQPGDMTVEEATQIIQARRNDNIPLDFDYLKGRLIKLNLDNPDFYDFDRDNGPGAGQALLDRCLKEPLPEIGPVETTTPEECLDESMARLRAKWSIKSQ